MKPWIKSVLLLSAFALAAPSSALAGEADLKLGTFTMHYREEGKGPHTIVMVHGFASTHHTWSALIPRLPAHQFRLIAVDLRGAGKSTVTDGGYSIDQAVAESLSIVNLQGLEEYPPLGLSFGQQKRTTIAAVLAMRSQIMIMDEPTAGQDYANYTHFMDEMCRPDVDGSQSLVAANFAATLFITHDLDLAVTYANRVLLVGDKHIVADGTPEEVLKDFDLLTRYRVRPTSLLRLNLEMLPRTKRFLAAEELAAYS